MKTPYVQVLNTGSSTSKRKTEKRIEDFLNAADEVSDLLVGGQIVSHVQGNKRMVMDLMKRYGHSVYAEGNKWRVKLNEEVL